MKNLRVHSILCNLFSGTLPVRQDVPAPLEKQGELDLVAVHLVSEVCCGGGEPVNLSSCRLASHLRRTTCEKGGTGWISCVTRLANWGCEKQKTWKKLDACLEADWRRRVWLTRNSLVSYSRFVRPACSIWLRRTVTRLARFCQPGPCQPWGKMCDGFSMIVGVTLELLIRRWDKTSLMPNPSPLPS